VREEIGLLGKDENGNSKSYEEVKRDRISRMSSEVILKQKLDEFLDSNGNLSDKGNEFIGEVEVAFERNPGRIKGIAASKDYTHAHEAVFEEVFEKLNKKNDALRKGRRTERERAKRSRASSSEGGEGGSTPPSSAPPAPPMHLGGPTIVGTPPEEPAPKPASEPVLNLRPKPAEEKKPEIVRDAEGTWRQVKEGESFPPGRTFRMDVSGTHNYVKMTEDEIEKLDTK
jgi:hypothetical protein